MKNNAGIIIPTKNRLEFVIRQLEYYEKFKSHHTVYIGDSSSKTLYEELVHQINRARYSFPVFTFSIPELGAEMGMKFLASKVSEDYCAFCGDDDFLVPDAIDDCIKVLIENKKARIAQGEGIVFTIENDTAYGRLNSLNYNIRNTHIVANSGAERLLTISKNFIPAQFSVHRTKEFLHDINEFDRIKDRCYTELLSNYMALINGDSIKIEKLYLIRQDHFNRNFQLDALDWLLSENWVNASKIFLDTLTNNLIQTSPISNEEAQTVAHQALSNYVSGFLKKKKNNHLSTNPQFLMRIVNRFPNLKRFLKRKYYLFRFNKYRKDLDLFRKFIEKDL